MYYENGYAHVIQELRQEEQISQQELAEKVNCSMGTISRIESGTQKPRLAMLRKILECLGEPGFCSDYYFEKEGLDILELQCNLLECYELEDTDRFERFLAKLAFTVRDDNSRQLFQFLELIHHKRIGMIKELPLEDLLNIINITIKGFKLGNNLSGILINQTEAYILNCIAIIHIKNSEYSIAKELLCNIISKLNKSRHFFTCIWKTRAGLYNNLAVCCIYTGQRKTARYLINKAIEYYSLCGGGYFGLKLLRTKYYIVKIENPPEHAGDLLLLKSLYGIFTKGLKEKKSFRDFMGEYPVIDIF